MSDLNVLAGAEDQFTDDELDAFVKRNQEAVNDQMNQSRAQFTDILYTSIPQQTSTDPDAMALVRFRGGPPNSDRTAYTARSIISSLVRDDADKLIKLKLPIADRNHLYWRIINTVLETEGRGQNAMSRWQSQFPSIYNRVRYGSEKPTINQFKYDRGWKGREWLLANVIDRKQISLHQAEKHTMLLCKDARVSRKNPDIVFYDGEFQAMGLSPLSLYPFSSPIRIGKITM